MWITWPIRASASAAAALAGSPLPQASVQSRQAQRASGLIARLLAWSIFPNFQQNVHRASLMRL